MCGRREQKGALVGSWKAEPTGQELGKKASESDGKVKKKARALARHEMSFENV